MYIYIYIYRYRYIYSCPKIGLDQNWVTHSETASFNQCLS